MPGSHSPSLRTLALRALREHQLIASGQRLLVAISGGPDSTALLHACWLLREKLGFTLAACGVDHGLRPEAASELADVAAFCRELDVPFVPRAVVVARGGNLQARARVARHAALREVAGQLGADRIATGHHADDRAETVLLRLLRGSGPRGLACLPPRAGILVRPLIEARRSDVELHLRRHGLTAARDPSNDDPRFLRTRVRKELLPVLTGLSPSIVNHLIGLADDLLPYVDVFPSDDLRRAHRETARRAARRGKPGVVVRMSGRDQHLICGDQGRSVAASAPGATATAGGAHSPTSATSPPELPASGAPGSSGTRRPTP